MSEKIRVYIDAVGIDCEVMRATLKSSVEFLGFIAAGGGVTFSAAQPEKISPELVKEINEKRIYVIVHGYGNSNVLKKQGVDEDLIIIFYDARIKNNFSQKIRKLNRVFKIHVWAWEFFKFVLNYDFSHRLSKHDDFRRWIEIKRDIRFIKKNGLDKKIILMGVNKFSEFYIEKVRDKIAFIIDEKRAGETFHGVKVTDYDEILSRNPNDYYYYIFDRLVLRRQQGNLIELGVSDTLIFWGGRTRVRFGGAGSALQDAFDPLIGYTRDDSGFTIFSNSDDEDVFKIVTLGGSTSDPKLENIKSWSEFLFETLSKMGMKIKVYAGGIGAYSAAQECLKCIRDAIVISPDVVISYSGVNDMFGTIYDVENHYFIRYYYPPLINKMLAKGYVRNTVAANVRVKHLILGLRDPSDKAEFWLKCEYIMHAVCNGFDIDFHACLQNILYDDIGEEPKEEHAKKIYLYEKCKGLVKENNLSWLHDMTEIFHNGKDIFFDTCHVFEKGNRIIAQNMLPLVLQSYNKRRRKS